MTVVCRVVLLPLHRAWETSQLQFELACQKSEQTLVARDLTVSHPFHEGPSSLPAVYLGHLESECDYFDVPVLGDSS